MPICASEFLLSGPQRTPFAAMIRSGNLNTNVNSKDAVVDLAKMRMTFSDATARRNALRKSKSVGNADVHLQYGGSLRMLPLGNSTSRRRNESQLQRSTSRSENSRYETRTVKSDTACLSPTKHLRDDLLDRSSHLVPKRSPSSTLDFDKPSPQHKSVTEKMVLSGHDRVGLQPFIGFDNSHPTALNLSSCFSDDDETIDDASTFASDEFGSFPTSIRISESNITMPSDLTESNATLTLSTSSHRKPRASTKTVTSRAAASESMSDFIPLPPTRKTSDRDSFGEHVKPNVPQQIQCFPMDESPMKPSRQTSIGKLLDGSSSSSLLTSLSIDLSPQKPKRQKSDQKFSSKQSFMSSGISVDSSPQKPERQKSNSSLLNCYPSIGSKSNHCDSKFRSSGPSRRKILRSESRLQPLLPTLTRRTSIRERDMEPLKVNGSDEEDAFEAEKQLNM
jgi:hypothetical protein